MSNPSPHQTQRSSEPSDPFPGHDGGRWAPVPSRVVASWPAGSFAENLAIDPDGFVFISLHSHDRVERYDPRSGAVETFARLCAAQPRRESATAWSSCPASLSPRAISRS